MFVLGLTGSIGMGKSTASAAFRSFGVPIFDADAAVHGLLGSTGAAVASVIAAFPDCLTADGAIDRRLLGRRVFAEKDALAQLEAIVHPLVQAAQRRFLARCAGARRPLVVLDIPLLYETGADGQMDAVVVVSAPAFVQAQRVLRRPGSTAERLAAIRQRQLPDAEKRRRADFIIPSGLGKRGGIAAVAHIIDRTRHHRGTAWPDRWRQRRASTKR